MAVRLAAVVAFVVGASSLVTPEVARAEPKERGLVVGVAPHLVIEIGNSCTRDADVVSCTDLVPFAGADITAHYWLIDFLAIGARFAGSKDLDGAEGVDSSGLTWDPEDQWLWRISAEARFDPPILPSGLWVGGEVGLAVLSESQESPSASGIREDSVTRAVPLLGLGIGWDLWLGESLALTPEVRGQVITFGDPPELREDVEARDYGASTWLDVALRLSYAF